jgi:hypothetical protein
MVNGKTPLVRCADVSRFQSVAAIDQPGVKVVANPAAATSALPAPTSRPPSSPSTPTT